MYNVLQDTKRTVPLDTLVFHSNFVSKTYRFWHSTCSYTVTLKPGLGSLKVIGTDTDQSAT